MAREKFPIGVSALLRRRAKKPHKYKQPLVGLIQQDVPYIYVQHQLTGMDLHR